jgi:hypothetical protein
MTAWRLTKGTTEFNGQRDLNSVKMVSINQLRNKSKNKDEDEDRKSGVKNHVAIQVISEEYQSHNSGNNPSKKVLNTTCVYITIKRRKNNMEPK